MSLKKISLKIIIMCQPKHKSLISIGLLLCAMLLSCGSNVAYNQFCHTPIEGWEKNDTLVFDISPMTVAGHYRQEIGLRTCPSFPFTGVSLLVEQTIEPGHRVSRDTLKCRLADGKGNILGQGVGYYQYQFILKDLSLNKGDSLHVCVRHIMKREILPGVSDVGLKLVRQ